MVSEFGRRWLPKIDYHNKIINYMHIFDELINYPEHIIDYMLVLSNIIDYQSICIIFSYVVDYDNQLHQCYFCFRFFVIIIVLVEV